jgi:hypothetical protein
MTSATTAVPTPEVGIPVSSEVVRLKSGLVVRRVILSNGTVKQQTVWPGDHPNAPLVDE